MVNIFLIAIFLCLVGVTIMVVYIVDRVRKIELNTAPACGAGSSAAVTTDERFGGLEGEALWEAVTATDDADPAKLEPLTELRLQFSPVLQRHIEELFEEGVLDGRQGVRLPPAETRAIKTAEGQVLSWLPREDGREIYQIGLERSSIPQFQHVQLGERLDRVAGRLFNAAGLTLPHVFSAYLLPSQSISHAPAPETLQIRPAETSLSQELADTGVATMPIVQEFKN
jgi:hypothetical protein